MFGRNGKITFGYIAVVTQGESDGKARDGVAWHKKDQKAFGERRVETTFSRKKGKGSWGLDVRGGKDTKKASYFAERRERRESRRNGFT